MQPTDKVIMDGNEAAAYIAYKTNEICAIYPITPSSPMGEWVDLWASQGRKNIWGDVPRVIEMQSEGGAAGTLHGALQAGSLTTTFTASQGLLLMLPNMFKIAGQLLPSVFHIASRSVATHALSIFGDHSDVMAVRQAGFAMLFSSNVQEVMDMALIAQAATLTSKVPFLDIFDGFRTSHEINKIDIVTEKVIREMITEKSIEAFKRRALNPENPFIRGTAQNPDVFFQNREAANSFYQQLPLIVKNTMQQFALLTGRTYHLFDYFGHPQADRLIVLMGSGTETVKQTVSYLNEHGEKTGVVTVRLFRPFSVKDFLNTLPSYREKGCYPSAIAVLDRTKEPGTIGEPLYQDIVNALYEGCGEKKSLPKIIGGRYGLSSKEFTPSMVKAIFDELKKDTPKNHFTIGIKDDVGLTSLEYGNSLALEENTFNCLFYGLGSDGTVSANKNSIKIIGGETEKYVQGYFVYDSRKAGTLTTSHLRFSSAPIHSPYLVTQADFIACHQFQFVYKYEVLANTKQGAVFLLNAPYHPEEVWNHLPPGVQQEIIGKKLQFYVIDATKAAKELQLGTRINTILQSCFFAISKILPQQEAIQKIKQAIEKTYATKGDTIVQKNFKAVDAALSNLHQVHYPKKIIGTVPLQYAVSNDAPVFVKETLIKIMVGQGDDLPVSSFPPDGTYPSATTQWEKRNIATEIPKWDEQLCTQCNKCVVICPHAAIRAKIYDKALLSLAPESFKSAPPIGKEFDKEQEAYTLQVAIEDCTGCGLCVEYCPISSKAIQGHKAINMAEQLPLREQESGNWKFFIDIPEIDRTRVNPVGVKGSQLLQPLFEFSGACAGCGETPYLKLLSQLYGDRLLIANATGCSSIYGGNLPTTPWAKNKEGRGPAWANSLFEDNAEFGLGIRLSVGGKQKKAIALVQELKNEIGVELAEKISATITHDEQSIQQQRKNILQLRPLLNKINHPKAKELSLLADYLVQKTIWIVGGDGWAYDIGFGGLDHVLASGQKVNILVMDTEVYSNTGGQASKATSIGAIAKFATLGKMTPKKNLAFHAISYGNVYVAQVALGAKDTQSLRAIHEANDHPGTSLVIAYSHCIEHGYDMRHGAGHQDMAVRSGYWPLFRYNPLKDKGTTFTLDCEQPTLPLKDYLYSEARFAALIRKDKARADELLAYAETDIRNRWEKINALISNEATRASVTKH